MSPEYYAGRPAMHKSVILCLAVYLRVSCPERGIGWARRKLCTDCASIILKARFRRQEDDLAMTQALI